MASSYRALCSDFYINQKISVKLDLPRGRETILDLFERIRTTGEGAAEDFSIDRYNAAQQERTKDLPPTELLEQYKQIRAETVQWVSSLKDEELEIKGRHPFLGETVIREMVKMWYIHNQLHYRDVKRALK